MAEDNSPGLVDKPWNRLTEQEKRAWEKAADTKGPVFAGGAKLTGAGFHQTVTASWARQRAREERGTLSY
jgi:hypothetical protein